MGRVKVNVESGIDRAGRKGAVSVVWTNSDDDYLGSPAVIIDVLTDPAILAAIACCEAGSLAF